MKNNRRKRLHSYIMFLLAVCILSGLFLNHVTDFFIGFFAGWNGTGNIEDARILFGNLGQMLGRIFTGALLLVISGCCYRRLRKKVTEPIERLACNMNEVREGNLTVRTPVDGDFEIVEIQGAFNSMVQELEGAREIRKKTEQENRRLYAGIAHDLKTPMTMVLGYAKLLVQNGTASDEDRSRYIRTIIEQTEHTNELLDSLLAYTKLENHAYRMKKEKRDIVECLRECAANYYPMLEKAEVRTELRLPDAEIPWVFDPVEMKRVFTNLLANVVKHNPPQTGCIILLEEAADKDNGKKEIRIIIADDGPKIPEDLQRNLFDPFVAGDDSRSTKKGSGLGLSISRKIIERHNGRLYYIDDWRDGYKCFQIELKSS